MKGSDGKTLFIESEARYHHFPTKILSSRFISIKEDE